MYPDHRVWPDLLEPILKQPGTHHPDCLTSDWQLSWTNPRAKNAVLGTLNFPFLLWNTSGFLLSCSPSLQILSALNKSLTFISSQSLQSLWVRSITHRLVSLSGYKWTGKLITWYEVLTREKRGPKGNTKKWGWWKWLQRTLGRGQVRVEVRRGRCREF